MRRGFIYYTSAVIFGDWVWMFDGVLGLKDFRRDLFKILGQNLHSITLLSLQKFSALMCLFPFHIWVGESGHSLVIYCVLPLPICADFWVVSWLINWLVFAGFWGSRWLIFLAWLKAQEEIDWGVWGCHFSSSFKC